MRALFLKRILRSRLLSRLSYYYSIKSRQEHGINVMFGHDGRPIGAVPEALGAVSGGRLGTGGAERAAALGSVYVRGLLLDGERKSVEPMARRLPDGNEQALQQFVGQNPWDWKPVWERLARGVVRELKPDAIWVIDDTGFPKQGDIRWE
jgi:hypothetical protein